MILNTNTIIKRVKIKNMKVNISLLSMSQSINLTNINTIMKRVKIKINISLISKSLIISLIINLNINLRIHIKVKKELLINLIMHTKIIREKIILHLLITMVIHQNISMILLIQRVKSKIQNTSTINPKKIEKTIMDIIKVKINIRKSIKSEKVRNYSKEKITENEKMMNLFI